MSSQNMTIATQHRSENQVCDAWPFIKKIFWGIIPICWLIEAASYPHTIQPDGISYLDIALACSKGNWRALVNGYWSPAYSAILTVWLSLVRPSPYREVEAVHFLNCLLLAAAMVCLEYFLSSLCSYIQYRSDGQDTRGLPDWMIKTIGFALFFWASLYMTPPSLVTPDMLVLGIALASGAILLQIAIGKNSWFKFALLGVVLGLGFLAKAVMFPLAFIFMAVSVVAVGGFRRTAPKVVICFFVFLLVSSPFVLALSKSKGRFTYSDTGAIAYAEYVNGISLFINWQGGPEGSGTPVHPTRKVFDAPKVYEYGGPIDGCYPPWSDPSYWYDGAKPHFQFKNQLAAIRLGFDQYFDIITRLSAVLAGFLVLLCWGGRFRMFSKAILSEIFLWGPALAAFGLYSLVHVESRFLPGFVILLWAALFSTLRIPKSDTSALVFRCVTIAIVSVLGFQIAWSVGHSVARLVSTRSFPEREIVQELNKSGVEEGDRVSFVGNPATDHYWAHLGRFSIVADVPYGEKSSFIAASPEVQSQVVRTFASFGVKAVVAQELPSEELARGWEKIGDTNYYVLFIRKQ